MRKKNHKIADQTRNKMFRELVEALNPIRQHYLSIPKEDLKIALDDWMILRRVFAAEFKQIERSMRHQNPFFQEADLAIQL